MHCLFYGQILPADRYMSHLGQYVGSLGFTSDDQTGVDVIEGRAFQPYPTVIICIHITSNVSRYTSKSVLPPPFYLSASLSTVGVDSKIVRGSNYN